MVFAFVAGAGGIYVWRMLPETRGATLAEVQRLLETGTSSAETFLQRVARFSFLSCVVAEVVCARR